jgi:H+/Cl- antiporter ClcA
MTSGALLGSVLGEGWSHLFAGPERPSRALLGAGVVPGASTQVPVSSAVFVLELAYNANTLMVPLLLAMRGAALTYHLFETRTTY